MKKIFLMLLFIFSLIGCGDSNSTKEKKATTEKQVVKNISKYSFYKDGGTSVKLQGNVFLEKPLSVEELEDISNDIISKNPNYENYFFYFKLPFSDDDIENRSEKFDLYYLIRKLGKDNFEIDKLYTQLEYLKVTLNEKFIHTLGINKISEISPIKIGTPIEDVVSKLGLPTDKNEKTYSYFVVNDKRQMLGTLYLEVTDNKISNVFFYSSNLKLSEEQTKNIVEYVLGNKKLSELNIRELFNIYSFGIPYSSFPSKLKYSKLCLGEIDPFTFDVEQHEKTFSIIIPANSQNYVEYVFSDNDEKLTKILIVSTKNDDDSYDKFLTDLSRTIIFLEPTENFIEIRNNILEKLDFSYDRFASKVNYKKKTNYEAYNISVVKNKNKITLEIKSQ